MTDLVNRTRIGNSVDKNLWEKFSQLADKTRINKSKLLDEAIEDLLRKYNFLENSDKSKQ